MLVNDLSAAAFVEYGSNGSYQHPKPSDGSTVVAFDVSPVSPPATPPLAPPSRIMRDDSIFSVPGGRNRTQQRFLYEQRVWPCVLVRVKVDGVPPRTTTLWVVDVIPSPLLLLLLCLLV